MLQNNNNWNSLENKNERASHMYLIARIVSCTIKTDREFKVWASIDYGAISPWETDGVLLDVTVSFADLDSVVISCDLSVTQLKGPVCWVIQGQNLNGEQERP